MSYDGFDPDGNPIQFGLFGQGVDSDGFTRMSGVCIGIVLRTKYADSPDNLLYQALQADLGEAMKASYLEADILLVYGGSEMFTYCPHAVVLPHGKASNLGPGEEEPADYSEDVPKGCTASELEEYFGGTGRLGVENFSGDWCVVGFVGGLLQVPVMTHWFPNPKNKRDAATRTDGERFTLRRNNSEVRIDKNGDLHITHRVGQYLQMNGKRITLKHREGAMLHINEEGEVYVNNKQGYSIYMNEDGISLTDGSSVIELADKKVNIQATDDGEVNVVANNLMLTGGSVIASSGQGGKALLHEDLIPLLEGLSNQLLQVETALALFATTQGKVSVGPLAGYLPGFEALATVMTTTLIPSTTTTKGNLIADQTVPAYRTIVLAGE